MQPVNSFQIRRQICDIGHRLWLRGFAAGFDGNISYRLSEDEVLCTPTMISKGHMRPEDLCLIDMEGHQHGGTRKRTSEILLHLAIMKARPDVRAVVHCHPPHPVAFSLAREPIPQCVLPEAELCLGEVPTAPYRTPGTQEVADSVVPFVKSTKIIILANHGTVSFDDDLERAFWWTEVLDSYCRILMLARQLGPVARFGQSEAQDLLDIKTKWGFADPRTEPGLENCDLCGNDAFRASWSAAKLEPRAFGDPASSVAPDVVDKITQQVIAALQANPTTQRTT